MTREERIAELLAMDSETDKEIEEVDRKLDEEVNKIFENSLSEINKQEENRDDTYTYKKSEESYNYHGKSSGNNLDDQHSISDKLKVSLSEESGKNSNEDDIKEIKKYNESKGNEEESRSINYSDYADKKEENETESENQNDQLQSIKDEEELSKSDHEDSQRDFEKRTEVEIYESKQLENKFELQKIQNFRVNNQLTVSQSDKQVDTSKLKDFDFDHFMDETLKLNTEITDVCNEVSSLKQPKTETEIQRSKIGNAIRARQVLSKEVQKEDDNSQDESRLLEAETEFRLVNDSRLMNSQILEKQLRQIQIEKKTNPLNKIYIKELDNNATFLSEIETKKTPKSPKFTERLNCSTIIR